MGVVAETGLAPNFERGIELGEVGCDKLRVFFWWDHVVGGADDEGDGDAFEFFGEGRVGDLRGGFGLVGGDAVGF